MSKLIKKVLSIFTPIPRGVVYYMPNYNCWGKLTYQINYPYLKVMGSMGVKPKVGDILTCDSTACGVLHEFQFTKVNYESKTNMFMGKIKYLGEVKSNERN